MTFDQATALVHGPQIARAAKARRYIQAAIRLSGRSDETTRLFRLTQDRAWFTRAQRQTTAAQRLLKWAEKLSQLSA